MNRIENTLYSEFLLENRVTVNRYLNRVLWFFALTGPAIASGIQAGIFPDITYTTCWVISFSMIFMSSVHMILRRKIPSSTFTCLFALTALSVLILYMSYSHVSIYLTWFLVPLLSLLFCDRFIFLHASILNYVLMGIAAYLTAPYYYSLRADYATAAAAFADRMSGFTIEYIIMYAGAFIIGKLTINYFKQLFAQNEIIRSQEKSMKERFDLLDSMAEIYERVNLLDFEAKTEMSLRDTELKRIPMDKETQTHTQMNQILKEKVMPDQIEDFLSFTNIQTVQSRLKGKKLISADFIDVVSGWFRAQYIVVKTDDEGNPTVVIYTTRNVEEEKQREEHLIRISMTDEMTRLFNRRCYDEDLMVFRKKKLPEDFVIFSVDVNGLKIVNDTKGHAAGDELIKGAADCLALTVGNLGKVYRTGGDEFMAIVSVKAGETLRKNILAKAECWHGVYTEKLSMSVGFASYKEHPEASIDDLEHLADSDMYDQKKQYYEEHGITPRNH